MGQIFKIPDSSKNEIVVKKKNPINPKNKNLFINSKIKTKEIYPTLDVNCNIDSLMKTITATNSQLEDTINKEDILIKSFDKKIYRLMILHEKQKIKKIQMMSIKDTISSLDKSATSLLLEDLGFAHHELNARFLHDYASLGLFNIAEMQARPHIIKFVQKWDPLNDPINKFRDFLRCIKSF